CPACGTRVFPSPSGECPSCRQLSFLNLESESIKRSPERVNLLGAEEEIEEQAPDEQEDNGDVLAEAYRLAASADRPQYERFVVQEFWSGVAARRLLGLTAYLVAAVAASFAAAASQRPGSLLSWVSMFAGTAVFAICVSWGMRLWSRSGVTILRRSDKP